MKKTFIFLALVLFSTVLFAKDHSNYVITDQGTFFFKKLKFGINNCLVGINENGEKVKFKKCEVISFARDGKQFEKMPVYKGNVPTGEKDFMAVLCYKNGLKLYEYEYVSRTTLTLSRRYYVFKGDKYVVEMDNLNKPTLTAFFSRK
jgi:hypothetical protein